jgi:hypothetical protein
MNVAVAPFELFQRIVSERAIAAKGFGPWLEELFADGGRQAAEYLTGLTREEAGGEISSHADETACLLYLTVIEALFRRDFTYRTHHRRPKDDITEESRALASSHHGPLYNIHVDQGLLQIWIVALPTSKALMGELRGAFKLRHWLAHGRYWQPKLGRTYDPAIIEGLLGRVCELPLQGPDPDARRIREFLNRT